jgi:hypothetical protein
MGKWESVGQEKDKPPLISSTRIGTNGSLFKTGIDSSLVSILS